GNVASLPAIGGAAGPHPERLKARQTSVGSKDFDLSVMGISDPDQKSVIGSPPFFEKSAARKWASMFLLMKWTDPSPMTTCAPPMWNAYNPRPQKFEQLMAQV